MTITLYVAVLAISFSSMTFSGTESSGGVIASIVMSGGTADRNIDIPIRLNGINATGQLNVV